MRLIGPVTLGLLLPVLAWAQQPPIQEAPLPPLQKQWQQDDAAPVQSPQAQQPGPGQDDTAQAPPAAPAPPAEAEVPNIWVPANTAKLQALDKVNAQATALTIKVGDSATYGSLTITVKACVVRPPDQPADAAAYLDVIDGHAGSPGFNGWLLENEPSVSMMQDPIYDIRVIGCA